MAEGKSGEKLMSEFELLLIQNGWSRLTAELEPGSGEFKLGPTKIYVDPVGVFVYTYAYNHGHIRRYGQSFEQMRDLPAKVLVLGNKEPLLHLDLVTGEGYHHDIRPLVG